MCRCATRGRSKRRAARRCQWSIRVNDQFRICFRWVGTDAEDVEIVDYH
ncbi:MAG TPA: type II toxin-antitoxin system RelE/ParE family toxin [Burkholderiales bacterium]|nr:type II toxin-antitoxin system RelE/ParE family toxin [Burkholderiales bacterium]